MTPTFHNLLVRDLVYQVTHYQRGQGDMLCVPEVQVPGARFDAVAIDTCSKHAAAIEVKVDRAGVLAWLRDERWKDALAVGAYPILAFPEGIDAPRFELPRGVGSLRKLRSGTWEPFRLYSALVGPVDPTLLFAVVAAVRRETFWAGYIESLGEPITEALARMDRGAA